MAGPTLIIHCDVASELFDDVDFNTTTVHSLLQRVHQRLYEEFKDILADPSDCLCDGPYASNPIDDLRLRGIAEMLRPRMPPSSTNRRSEPVRKPMQLWLCNCNKITFFSLII